MTKQFTLGKNERVKSRKLTEQLFREGKRLNVPPFRIHYLTLKTEEHMLQFGVGVSSRTFKRSVDRNRVKRLLREVYRLQKLPLQQLVKEQQGGLAVFFVYTGRQLPVYAELYDRMGKSLADVCKLIKKPKT